MMGELDGLYKTSTFDTLRGVLTPGGNPRAVRLLLDTDRGIGHEMRVGVIPAQLLQLRRALGDLGISLSIIAVRGAGERAGFADAEYEAAGASLVDADKFNTLPAVDVVHALKEPTEHEAEISKPFLRIGALHLASKPTGVGSLIASRSTCALFDGSTIGYCSDRLTGGDRTPIVASMSRIAGEIALARLLSSPLAHSKPGKVVVVGGGNAGLTVIVGLKDSVHELIVVEIDVGLRDKLAWLLRTLGVPKFAVVEQLSDDLVDGAMGIVFAHRLGAQQTEQVCRIDNLRRRIRFGGTIVDIAIDQGGSITYDAITSNDSTRERIEKYKLALPDHDYYAESNMPRLRPARASEKHGEAVLPYLLALLYLCAQHTGPMEAAEHLVSTYPRSDAPDDTSPNSNGLVDCVFGDLRNGLELLLREGRATIMHPDIVNNVDVCSWVNSGK